MKYLIAIRIKQWVKNLFVLIPLLVSGSFFNSVLLLESIIAFFTFCLVSSCVYIINDLVDKEKDEIHPIKKNRPIASGKVTFNSSIFLIVFMFFIVIFLQYISINPIFLVVLLYFILNIFYSFVLKKIVIIDVLSISLGFVLRVEAGVLASNLESSPWLIAMTFTLAMLLALGKRKGELEYNNKLLTRESLNGYSKPMINNMQNIFVSCTLIFYLLFVNLNTTFLGHKEFLYASAIFVIAGLLRYVQLSFSEILEEEPTEILYKDKFIMISVFLWGLLILLSFII